METIQENIFSPNNGLACSINSISVQRPPVLKHHQNGITPWEFQPSTIPSRLSWFFGFRWNWYVYCTVINDGMTRPVMETIQEKKKKKKKNNEGKTPEKYKQLKQAIPYETAAFFNERNARAGLYGRTFGAIPQALWVSDWFDSGTDFGGKQEPLPITGCLFMGVTPNWWWCW